MPLLFIDKRPRGGLVVANPGTPTLTPTIVDGLHGGDVVISISGLTMFIIQSGIVVVHAALEKIANWSIDGTRIIIHSLDETSLELSFVSQPEALIALATIEGGINLV